jgi:type I restriction enzyme R subunit
MSTFNPIAELNNFIVLDQYTKYSEANDVAVAYQTEAALETEFISEYLFVNHLSLTKFAT